VQIVQVVVGRLTNRKSNCPNLTAVRYCGARFVIYLYRRYILIEKDVDRFHYFIAGLSGPRPPLMIVKSVPLTAKNYNIAWRALNNQYNNKHLINAHLDKLFTFERIQRESFPALTSFISTFHENVAAIKALGVDDWVFYYSTSARVL